MEISHVHFIQVTDKYCPSGASNLIVPVYICYPPPPPPHVKKIKLCFSGREEIKNKMAAYIIFQLKNWPFYLWLD